MLGHKNTNSVLVFLMCVWQKPVKQELNAGVEYTKEKRCYFTWKGASLFSFLCLYKHRTPAPPVYINVDFVSRLYTLSSFFSAHQSFVTISNSLQVPQLIEPWPRDLMQPHMQRRCFRVKELEEFQGRKAPMTGRALFWSESVRPIKALKRAKD